MDHFWKSIHGYFTWPDFYSHVADRVPHYSKIVEVGACCGQSAAYLGVELMNRKKACKFDLVDTFDGRIHPDRSAASVRRVLEPIAPVLGAMVEGCSWLVPAGYENESLDAVFIDADHSYESVVKDIAAWTPKVKRGGIIAGHDFCVDFSGVIRAVSEAFPRWECWRGERWGDTRMQGTGDYYSVWSVVR